MFERYTEQARRAIFSARFGAIHRATSISTVHLLVALSWEENSRAAIIGSLKDKMADLSTSLSLPYLPCTEVPYDQQADVPFDRDSKKALAYSAEEANWEGRKEIDTDHLLRGLLRFDNESSRALEALSVDLRSVRAGSKRYRGEIPPKNSSLKKSIASWLARHLGMPKPS